MYFWDYYRLYVLKVPEMNYKNVIFTIILFFTLQEVSAQNTPINQYNTDGKKSGLWESYYESGKVKSRGTFINGHPAGEMLKYYPGGILQARMNFDDSGITSYVKLYYETGNLAAEGKYINQLKDSVWNYFSAYDKRKAMSETYLTGKKHGESFKYYANGKPSEYLEWQNDLKNGKWEQYFENGQVRLTGFYLDGNLNGEFISYNPDGSLSITGSYLSGALNGIWKYFNNEGEPELTVEYRNGIMLPNEEMDKRIEEFSKKVKEAIGNLDESEIQEFQ